MKRLPSAEQLAKLPKRAMVCYAARAAMRVFPLYTGDEPAVARAIEVAAQYAGGDASTSLRHTIANTAQEAKSLVSLLQSGHFGIPTVHVVHAVYAAADAVCAAALVDRPAGEDAARDAAHAAHAVIEAIDATDDPASPEAAEWSAPDAKATRNASILDYEAIKALAPHIGDGPWDPSESGPLGRLWPLGAPGWWPESETCKGKALRVSIEVRDDATTEELAALAEDMSTRLNKHCLNVDGDGVLLSPEIEVREPSREEVPSA